MVLVSTSGGAAVMSASSAGEHKSPWQSPASARVGRHARHQGRVAVVWLRVSDMVLMNGKEGKVGDTGRVGVKVCRLNVEVEVWWLV